MLTHFHPLVVGAATLLSVLRDEAAGVAVAWDRVAVSGGGVCVPLVDGQEITGRGLERVAPAAARRDTWLRALIGLAQATLQTTGRWPDLPPSLPATLRCN